MPITLEHKALYFAYAKRKTTVTPLTDWLEIEAATEFINNL